MFAATTDRVAETIAATIATEARWPTAIGGSERSTTRALRSCMPRATAKSQPMAGFSPWKAPSPARARYWPRVTSGLVREAVGVRRRVAALQPRLVGPQAAELVAVREER